MQCACFCVFWFLLSAACAQQDGGGQGSIIPNLPLPTWVNPELTGYPSNVPGGVPEWQPYRPPQQENGNSESNNGGGGGIDIGTLLSLLTNRNGGGNGAAGNAARALMSGRATVVSYHPGDPRNCLNGNKDLNILHVIPGIGWDNLRNTETGLLTHFTYTQCKVTFDRKYLIPDQTFAIPIKTSIIERQAELFDHWDTYKSVTSRSINSEFDFFGRIGGKFSNEYQDIKSKQFTENAVTMRVELRHKFYTIKQLPEATLHRGFKNRLLEVLSLIKSNDSVSAEYVAQLVVRDYGTHCLSSLDAGAVLIKQDNLKYSVMTHYNGNANSLSAAAGVDFYDALKIKVGGGFSNYNGQSSLNSYRNNRTSSKIYTYGGPPFRLGMNVSEWEMDLRNNLVATDRQGKPIHTLITSQTMLPEVTDTTDVYVLRRMIQDSIKQYYEYNTHVGCTNPRKPNFDYQANEGTPGLCKAASSNYTFGGVFQTCKSNGKSICGRLIQKNPLTGAYSCPKNFQAVLLHVGGEKRGTMKQSCRKERKCTFFIFNCRNIDICTNVPSTEVATVQTFWCASKVQNRPKFGYMFGGLYSNDIPNPITKSRSCPLHYIPLRVGSHAFVCVSEDYEQGHVFSLPFGGFFSCISGNMLSAINGTNEFLNNPRDWPMRCPDGFTQHLALTEKSCRINFCVKAGSLLRAIELELIAPPYDPKPPLKQNSTMNLYLPNVTSSSQVQSQASRSNGAGGTTYFSGLLIIALFISSIFY